MKRILMVMIVLLMVVGTTNAQGEISIGIYPGVTIPTGDFGDVYGVSFGFAGTFFYRIGQHIDITGSAGYLRWSETESIPFFGDIDVSITSIPVLAGLRYYFEAGDANPYIGAEAGMHFMTFKASAEGISMSESETEFGWGIGGGLVYALSDNMDIDANIKYNSINTEGDPLNFISIMAGLRFRLN